MKPTVFVEFKSEGKKGTISYFEKTKSVDIDFPVKEVVDKILKYFQREQEYKIPESDQIDDYRIDKAKPVDEQTYFTLSLCGGLDEAVPGVDVKLETLEK